MSFTRAKIGIRVPKRWIYNNMEEREGGGSKPQPCGLQTKVFIIERAALCCCSIFKHFCSFMVYKDLWPLKLYFQHERAGFGLNQCVSAGLQLSEAVVWGGEVGVSSVRRVMEQQQSPSCCCVLVLHPPRALGRVLGASIRKEVLHGLESIQKSHGFQPSSCFQQYLQDDVIPLVQVEEGEQHHHFVTCERE